jgi:hypothetical protein
MTRITVADLTCASSSCCGSTSLAIGDISAATKAWFIAGGVIGDGDPDEGTQPEFNLMTSYVPLIEVATKQLSSLVCMKNYAADCTITVDVCVTGEPDYDATDCDVETVPLPELDTVLAERVLSVTIDGGAVVIDEDNVDAWMLTSNGGWRVSGPVVTARGSFEIVVTLKPSLVEWDAAVAALVCDLAVAHSSSCSAGEDALAAAAVKAQLVSMGLTGTPIADALPRDCVSRSVGMGRPSPVKAIVWAAP